MEVEILGSELRASRLQRELSLEEVEQELRIRAKFLRAIETGDYSLLPSQVQARGFLRNYAIFLGLDANAILARYEQAMGQIDAGGPNGHLPTPAQVVVAKPLEETYPGKMARQPGAQGVYNPNVGQTRRRRRAFSSTNILFSVASIFVIVALAWGSTRLVEALIAADRQVESQSGSINEFIGELDDQPSPTPSATFLAQSAEATEVAQVNPIEEGVHAVFDVTQRTWLRVTVDEVVLFEGIAVPGETQQYQGEATIHIRAGNAAGLGTTINGRDIGPIGTRGELVDMTFSPDFQPTTTPEITPTPQP